MYGECQPSAYNHCLTKACWFNLGNWALLYLPTAYWLFVLFVFLAAYKEAHPDVTILHRTKFWAGAVAHRLKPNKFTCLHTETPSPLHFTAYIK